MSDEPKGPFSDWLAKAGMERCRRERMDHCGGALLKEFDAEGMAVDRRVSCSGTARPREALCSRCAGLEAENRRWLRDRQQSKKPASGGRRGFGEDST